MPMPSSSQMPAEIRRKLMLIGLGVKFRAWDSTAEQDDGDSDDDEWQRVYVDRERQRILRAM